MKKPISFDNIFTRNGHITASSTRQIIESLLDFCQFRQPPSCCLPQQMLVHGKQCVARRQELSRRRPRGGGSTQSQCVSQCVLQLQYIPAQGSKVDMIEKISVSPQWQEWQHRSVQIYPQAMGEAPRQSRSCCTWSFVQCNRLSSYKLK